MSSNKDLLDQLMGKDRDKLPTERPTNFRHFYDPKVCKYFICGFCPHDLFINTKSDIGPCHKIHDEDARQEFQECKTKSNYPYEKDWLNFLQRLVDDVHRKIRKGQERVEHREEIENDMPLDEETNQKISAISNEIQTLLKKIEDLGEEGKVSESQQLMTVVDKLKLQKEQILLSYTMVNDSRFPPIPEKQMKVCEICGALLVVKDTEKRVINHLEGKQHQGFILIRKTLEEKKLESKDEERRTNRTKEMESNRKDRERYKERKDSHKHYSSSRDDKKRERDYENYDSGHRKRFRDHY